MWRQARRSSQSGATIAYVKGSEKGTFGPIWAQILGPLSQMTQRQVVSQA